MHRRSLIKCILGLATAPKILAEMDFEPPIVAQPLLTKSLIKDMQLLTPQFYMSYVEKYGSQDFSWWLAEIGKHKETPQDNNYFWFERNRT